MHTYIIYLQYCTCMCYWDSKGPVSFIKSFGCHLCGCKPFFSATQIGIEDVNLCGEKKTYKLEEAMPVTKPNFVSTQDTTNGSAKGNNSKFQAFLEWARVQLYKLPLLNISEHDFFSISVCSIFAVSPGCSGRVSSAFIAQRLEMFPASCAMFPSLGPWHPCHVKREKLRKTHTNTLTSEIDVLTWS